MWKQRLNAFAGVLESDARRIKKDRPSLAKHQRTIAALARAAAKTRTEVDACRVLDYLIPDIRVTLIDILAGRDPRETASGAGYNTVH